MKPASPSEEPLQAPGLGPAGRPDSALTRALLPLSWVYGEIARLRRTWHTKRSRRLDCPVVSVGNITCGGTGKTPTVEMVVRDLLAAGWKPAILSRGYKAFRSAGGLQNDEARVLAANLPGVAHSLGKDRYAAGREAISRGADVLVLDDGFQHARLHRDLDFVLIDAILPFGHGHTLPAGLLREPLGVLSRAHLLGITRSDQVGAVTLSTLRSYLRRRFPGIPQVLLSSRPVEWVRLGGGTESPEGLRSKQVLAFCGVGNPESFRRQVLSLGLQIAELLCFRDHHQYTAGDLDAIAARAAQVGTDEVVMTQKDAVKIGATEHRARWKYLRIRQEVCEGAEEYLAALAQLRSCQRNH